MAAESTVRLTSLRLPDALFVPELIFTGYLFLCTCLQKDKRNPIGSLQYISAAAGLVTLSLLATCHEKVLENACRLLLDVVSQVVLLTMYCCVFFTCLPIRDSRKNDKDVMDIETLCGGLMLLHIFHAVLSVLRYLLRKSK